MSGRFFVTGMLRSGTTLLQTLLTNHPQLLVVYQPFHQLHVDVKQIFLDEQGCNRALPLDDGGPERNAERTAFRAWLAERVFDQEQSQWLADRATAGKGGGIPELAGMHRASAGTFFDLADGLHATMAGALADEPSLTTVASKEVLCEEFVPASLDAGIRCILIVRDPRAVIASANHGRYRESVGDRYPLLMLIRQWRKSANIWLNHREHPLVQVVRYEDLIESPKRSLERITSWLDIGPHAPSTFKGPLLDHAGRPWRGNSSFGDMPGIDATAGTSWQTLLDNAEIEFIQACTKREMAALGYRFQGRNDRTAIEAFTEDLSDVRPGYLDQYALDADNRNFELRVWEEARAKVAAADRIRDL